MIEGHFIGFVFEVFSRFFPKSKRKSPMNEEVVSQDTTIRVNNTKCNDSLLSRMKCIEYMFYETEHLLLIFLFRKREILLFFRSKSTSR